MRRLIFTAITASLLASASFAKAADSPSAPTAPRLSVLPEPTPPGLTINDCLILLQGLNGLDLHQVVLNAGKPNESIAQLPYDFQNATMRLKIGRNIAELGAVQREAQAVQEKITAEVSKGEELKPGSKEMAIRDGQIRDLLNQPCRAHLERFNASDLRLDRNEIPSSILAALDKILDQK